MNDTLRDSLIFTSTIIGLYYLFNMIGELMRIYVTIHRHFKRGEDEKMLQSLVDALNAATHREDKKAN